MAAPTECHVGLWVASAGLSPHLSATVQHLTDLHGKIVPCEWLGQQRDARIEFRLIGNQPPLALRMQNEAAEHMEEAHYNARHRLNGLPRVGSCQSLRVMRAPTSSGSGSGIVRWGFGPPRMQKAPKGRWGLLRFSSRQRVSPPRPQT